MARQRLSYRVETYRHDGWQSEGLFDDHALARAQAGQFADSQGNKGVRVLAESSDGAYRELVYDPAQGIDGTPAKAADGGQAGGSEAGGGAVAGAGEAASSPPNPSRGQVLTAMAVLAVGALVLALVLILIFDPLG